MKKYSVLFIFFIFLAGCSDTNNLKKENELLKKEISLLKSENEALKIKSGTLDKLGELVQKDKLKTTMEGMKKIMTALGSYITDRYEAPPSLDKTGELYANDPALTDAWGKKIFYKIGTNHKDEYWIASAGADGIFGGWDEKDWSQRGSNPNNVPGQDDIIAGNGDFIYIAGKYIK